MWKYRKCGGLTVSGKIIESILIYLKKFPPGMPFSPVTRSDMVFFNCFNRTHGTATAFAFRLFCIFGGMRKIEKIKAGFRLCTITLLYVLFFVTQLVSVNVLTQHASIYIFSPKLSQSSSATERDRHTVQADDEEEAGVRLNKRFSNKAFINFVPPEWDTMSFTVSPSFCTARTNLIFFEIVPDRLLLGPPSLYQIYS